MKSLKNILIISFLGFILLSCDSNQKELDKFANTYYEILVIREQFQDTSIANSKISEILRKNGFTMDEFKKESFRLYNEDQIILTKMIDSMRKKADRELIEIGKQNRKLQRKNSLNDE